MKKIEPPKGWQLSTLGHKDVATIIMGQSPPGSTYNKKKNGLPFYQGKTDFGEKYPTPSKWCSEPIKIAKPNDILISVRAPVGPTNWAKEECCIGRGLAVIRAKIIPEFIYYFLKWIEPQLAKSGTGSTFKAIGKNFLHNLEVPIPDEKIQKKISNKLDKILEDLKQQRNLIVQLQNKKINEFFSEKNNFNFEKNTTHIDRVFRNHIIYEVFCGNVPNLPKSEVDTNFLKKKSSKINSKNGKRSNHEKVVELLHQKYKIPKNWIWTKFEDLIELISGQHILSKDYNEKKDGIPYLTGPIDFGFKYPNISKWTSKPKVIAKKNDVLITVKGNGVGKVNLLSNDEVCISRQLMAIRTNNIIPELLYYFLLSEGENLKKLADWTTVPGIGRESIYNLEIPLPPQPIQSLLLRHINSKLEILDHLKQKNIELFSFYKNSISKINQLEQAVLNSAFTGKLL